MKKLTAFTAAIVLSSGMAWAEGQTHYIAFHVDQNDPKVMNLALNNVVNVAKYYENQGDEVVIEVVAYGPGLNMYIPEKSPVRDRISAMSLGMENISFAACGNTLHKMEERAGHEISLMDEATVTPSGVVRLVELQQQGYAYVKP